MGLDGHIERKGAAEGADVHSNPIRLPSLSRDAIQPDVKELVADVLAQELRSREKHIEQQRNRRVLGVEEIQALSGPLEARMRAGILDKERLDLFNP